MDRLFQLYKTVLLAHIQTKTTESQFHEKSQEFYELLFEVFHLISEKRVDLELDEVKDCDILIQDTYNAIEEAKTIVYDMVKEDNSIGMDNLLRGLADKLEGACGNSRAFIKEEEEEYEPKEVKPMIKSIRIPSKY